MHGLDKERAQIIELETAVFAQVKIARRNNIQRIARLIDVFDLLEICACPGISQEQLARRIYINKSNVARQLAILEENGYVTRRPGEEDRRVMRVYPTEKAQAALPRIQEIMGNWEEAVAMGLTAAEREKLSDLLEDMTRRASALLEE